VAVSPHDSTGENTLERVLNQHHCFLRQVEALSLSLISLLGNTKTKLLFARRSFSLLQPKIFSGIRLFRKVKAGLGSFFEIVAKKCELKCSGEHIYEIFELPRVQWLNHLWVHQRQGFDSLDVG